MIKGVRPSQIAFSVNGRTVTYSKSPEKATASLSKNPSSLDIASHESIPSLSSSRAPDFSSTTSTELPQDQPSPVISRKSSVQSVKTSPYPSRDHSVSPYLETPQDRPQNPLRRNPASTYSSVSSLSTTKTSSSTYSKKPLNTTTQPPAQIYYPPYGPVPYIQQPSQAYYPSNPPQTYTYLPKASPRSIKISTARMSTPACALTATWKVVRAMQLVSLISIIGMVSNFISEMVTLKQSPPSILIGTLAVTILATLYCFITTILLLSAYLSFILATAFDFLLLIAVIVVAVTVGKPLSYLDCVSLPALGDSKSFLSSVGENIGKVNYFVWAGASGTTCFEMKAVWGLSIALCVLFATSAVCGLVLWKMERDGKQGGNGEEDGKSLV